MFTRTQYGDGGVVLDCGYNPTDDAVYVLTFKKEMVDVPFGKPWALCKITLQDGYFIHENQHSFFEEDGGLDFFPSLDDSIEETIEDEVDLKFWNIR